VSKRITDAAPSLLLEGLVLLRDDPRARAQQWCKRFYDIAAADLREQASTESAKGGAA
jgi:hypothetical protein